MVSLKKLILGSSSPRRQELLKSLNIPFTVRTPNFDESTLTLTNPLQKAEQLAKLKAQNVSLQSADEIILAADTIVAYNGTIFEKPVDQRDAYHMISKLNGTKHDVITAVALRSSDKETVFSVKTEVYFWELTEAEIDAYIATTEPYDKAGAYGIQGKAGLFVKEIKGDYFNVVGLPVSYVVRELRRFNFDVDMYVHSE